MKYAPMFIFFLAFNLFGMNLTNILNSENTPNPLIIPAHWIIKQAYSLNMPNKSIGKSSKKIKPITPLCDRCNKIFKNKQTMVRHIRRGCIGAHPIMCPQCQTQFIKISALHLHLKIMHQYENQQITWLIELLKEKPNEFVVVPQENTTSLHVCHWDNCANQYPTPQALENHLNLDHFTRQEGVLHCQWKNNCGYSSLSRSAFKLHTRKHTKNLPFACPTCKQKFSRPSSIKNHTNRCLSIKKN